MEIDLTKYGYREGFSWENRFNLKTQVGKYEVSTVDLGLNHQFIEELPPLYYETMIFIKGDTFEDIQKMKKTLLNIIKKDIQQKKKQE